jgi:RHS repeat-associated protein
MAGISSKAAGKLENKKQYAGNELQSKEFADGSGLDFYDFNARSYDHQIGRFHQIDPMTDEGGQESLTPFQYCGNNPVLYSDPDGKLFFVLPIVYYAVAAGVAAGVTYVAVKHPINVTGAVAKVKTAINETHAKNAAAGDVGIVTGSPLGLTTGTAYRKLNAEEAKETSAGTQSNEAATSSTDDTDAATENAINLDGSFSITKEKMATFPDPALKPSEKLKVLQGQEYLKARATANNENAKIHRSDPSSKGKEIHEKDSVKFGGSPTNPANKVQLTPKAHKEITTWFNQLLREINQLQPKK